MLSLFPQTDEFSRCNSTDRVEVEEQLVVDTNQSNDAQFAQKINKIKENEVVVQNSSMRQGDKHTPEKLHDVIQMPKSDLTRQLEYVACRQKKNDNVMSPTLYISNLEVTKIIQESETAMLLKPNSAIKSPMVTSNTSAHEVSKEKQREMSTHRWDDLVDEEEHVSPPLLNRKLSPQALEFVPKSIITKKN
ncbi:hypothetical protein R3W88_017283 [Solanum pinnatisectum]|uniref:Uncharacterized protein n=1 Tax=Solanum pinnatisectum TaxID=50273 RepID=A0AAV9KZR8_9SOLN|nr:hypothetical protein R3W88_017283 [Solanum pinnatisectum]